MCRKPFMINACALRVIQLFINDNEIWNVNNFKQLNGYAYLIKKHNGVQSGIQGKRLG